MMERYSALRAQNPNIPVRVDPMSQDIQNRLVMITVGIEFCMGVIIGPRMIIAPEHIVTRSTPHQAILIENSAARIFTTRQIRYVDDYRQDQGSDLAIIFVHEDFVGINIPTFDPLPTPNEGESVFATGFYRPNEVWATLMMVKGMVTDVDTVLGYFIPGIQLRPDRIYIDPVLSVQSYGGESGSPLVDSNDNIRGILYGDTEGHAPGENQRDAMYSLTYIDLYQYRYEINAIMQG